MSADLLAWGAIAGDNTSCDFVIEWAGKADITPTTIATIIFMAKHLSSAASVCERMDVPSSHPSVR